jgi:ribosomal peptide maturation radical SAM protein 1
MEQQKNNKFLFVVPAMRNIYTPPLGVSILQAGLKKNGVPAEVLYTNLMFVRKYGEACHLYLAEVGPILCDYLFSYWLFERTPEDLRNFARVLDQDFPWVLDMFKILMPYKNIHEILAWFVEAAGKVIDETLREIAGRRIKYLGLSSNMTENCFCLLVIRRVKLLCPEIVTIMGGANCAGEMGEELFGKFPEIDYLCQGEAEKSLLKLIAVLQKDGKPGEPIEGVLAREYQNHPDYHPRDAIVLNLDESPDPDYQDYYDQRADLPVKWERRQTILLLESSRGCWWAAKHRCAFCGLNPFHKDFRSKSMAYVTGQFARVTQKYPADVLFFPDALPDHAFFKNVLPELAKYRGPGLWVETIGAVTRQQFDLFADANVHAVQPGIESFSARSLKLMGKCTSVLANLQTLKWSMEVGIYSKWNFLYGIPGEAPEEIAELETLVAKITHFYPPCGPWKINLQRFSRYFESPEQYGLEPILIPDAYQCLYPLPEESLKKLLYFFDSQYFRDWTRSDAWKRLAKATGNWHRIFWRSHLVYVTRPKGSLILDTRPCRSRIWRRLSALESRIYEYCDKNHTQSEIIAFLGRDTNEREVNEILRRFVDDRIMIEHHGYYLGLAVKLTGKHLRNYRRFEPEKYAEGIANLSLREMFKLKKQLGISTGNFTYSAMIFTLFKFLTELQHWRYRCFAKIIRAAFRS